MTVRGELTVNFPVAGSNPTCTVCSKSTGDEMSIFLPSARVRVRKDKKKESRRDKAVTQHNERNSRVPHTVPTLHTYVPSSPPHLSLSFLLPLPFPLLLSPSPSLPSPPCSEADATSTISLSFTLHLQKDELNSISIYVHTYV